MLVEDAVDRTDQGPAVRRHGGQGQQAHTRQPLTDLAGVEAAFGRDDAAEVCPGPGRTSIEQDLQRFQVRWRFVHGPSLSPHPASV